MTFEHWFYNKRNKMMCGGEDKFTFECFRHCWEDARNDLKKEILTELDFEWTCDDVCPQQCTGLKEAKCVVEKMFVK
jgi:hypothetical protein